MDRDVIEAQIFVPSEGYNPQYSPQPQVFYPPPQFYNQLPPAYIPYLPPPNWYPAEPQGMNNFTDVNQGTGAVNWDSTNSGNFYGSSSSHRHFENENQTFHSSRPQSARSVRSDRGGRRDNTNFNSGRNFEGKSRQAGPNQPRERGRGRGGRYIDSRNRRFNDGELARAENDSRFEERKTFEAAKDSFSTEDGKGGELESLGNRRPPGARPKSDFAVKSDYKNSKKYENKSKLDKDLNNSDKDVVDMTQQEDKTVSSGQDVYSGKYGQRRNDRDRNDMRAQGGFRENYQGRQENNSENYNSRKKNFNNEAARSFRGDAPEGKTREGRKKGQLLEMREDRKTEDGSASYSQSNTTSVDNKISRSGSGPQRSGQGYGRRNNRSKWKGSNKIDESQRGVLIEQLTEGSYECMVCCDMIRANSAVWSCDNCYHIFHLFCIKKWAKSPNAIVSGSEKDGWRCPACQNLTFKFPSQYRCFCGKVRDPDHQRRETPHSCGEVCKKSRGVDCKHPCTLLCHPGPCPPCSAIVTKSCDCKKTKLTVKCGQSASVKCTSTCEKQLNCGKHFCQAKCHSGTCEKCEVIVTQACYCTSETREVTCGSSESFKEAYSCKNICSKVLDCGNHTCELQCHTGQCDGCSDLPERCLTCPCGSKSLQELCDDPRTSCLDPISVCESRCNKPLTCGPEDDPHYCQKSCHNDLCGPCKKQTDIRCRCKAIRRTLPCTQVIKYNAENPFQCDKRCKKLKTCGRHKCGQTCCVKTEHHCEQVCGSKLPCGLHKCLEPCHRGNCPPCLMASFDELLCHCGQEVMYPPVPCGTRPPECHRPCSREHSCQHQVRHNCHSEENCPPCTELTIKWCMGKHIERRNIVCHLTDVSCGMQCKTSLPCGQHKCIKVCHKGECLTEDVVCKQPCSLKREFCDHPCATPCHTDTPCPKVACQAAVSVKCSCGRKEARTVCGKGGQLQNEVSEFQRITMKNLADAIQGGLGCNSIEINKFSAAKRGLEKQLECDSECALIERNKRFAQALDIHNPELSSKLALPQYNDSLRDYAKQNPHFVATVEKEFSDLVQNAEQSKQPHRSHSFSNMKMAQRKLVHELAEFYGIKTQSYDYEPLKNVVATAYKNKCWLPPVTLTSLIQRELHGRAPIPIPHFHKEETIRQNAQAAKQSTQVFSESSRTGDGWNIVARTKKPSKSDASYMDSFDGTSDSVKLGQTKAPVVDYFDFTQS